MSSAVNGWRTSSSAWWKNELKPARVLTRSFITENYKVTFPMFSKVSIKGDAKHPLYADLQYSSGEVGWNFEKFHVGEDGKVLKRFGSDVEPESPELLAAIEAALK
jgi:glutathione peroxidase